MSIPDDQASLTRGYLVICIYRQGENGEIFPQQTVNTNGTEITVFNG